MNVFMQTYLVQFFGGDPDLKYWRAANAPKEKREVGMKAWQEWNASLAKKGALETGYALDIKGARIGPAGAQEQTFPDDDSSAGGFIVLKAESLAAALELLKDAPIIKNGGTVEVRLCGGR